MIKHYIDLPEGLHFLEDYKELEPQILSFHTCVFNKVVTGCGATTMFLDDPLPTILCSPRKALMFCKANSNRFKGRIYLYRNESDPDDAKPIDLMNRIRQSPPRDTYYEGIADAYRNLGLEEQIGTVLEPALERSRARADSHTGTVLL